MTAAADRRLLYAAAFLRAVATGLMGVLLGLYLARRGFDAIAIGLVIGSGLSGAAVATLVVTFFGDRLGRRATLLALATLAALGGIALLLTEHLAAVCAVAFVGMVNGAGVKAQAPKIFGKLLYGSMFHRLKQSRGQQGIGIRAAAMYGQLTTGQPIRVTSRVGKGKPAHYFEIQIDTRKNNPVVTKDDELDAWHQEHGTRVELEIVANWQAGQRFVNRYVEHTALSNPHATVHYLRPRQERITFPRAAEVLPKEALEIRPHPHGVELGALMTIAADSRSRFLRYL